MAAIGPGDQIKLRWLVRLRWAALLGQAVTIASVALWHIVHLPVRPLLLLVALGAAVNVALEARSRRTGPGSPALLGAVMTGDALLLTLLLALSGGYSNPFSTLYLVNVALATVLLPPRWSWAVLVASIAAFGSLFLIDRLPQSGLGLSPLDHQELMKLHLRGMWVALAVAAVFIVYVVNRVTRSLRERERELAAERSLSARKDKVASLAALAAGAAHELSTPFTTIAVAARELERALAGAPPAVREDLALIREQLGRCQEILGQMSLRAGENAGEPIVPIVAADWAAEALGGLADRGRVRVTIEERAQSLTVQGPAAALSRSLRSLLKNALQASPPEAQVELRLRARPGALVAEVSDRGGGIVPEHLPHVGEPFFTTKPPSQGLGLGIFLARSLAEHLGGSLELRSTHGAGTTVLLTLPAAGGTQSAGAEEPLHADVN